MKNLSFMRIAIAALFLIGTYNLQAQSGVLISSDEEQSKLTSTFRFILEQANNDYRTSDATDNELFPGFGEFSIYRITTGVNAGDFIYPNGLPNEYASLVSETYSNYNWQRESHVSVQFKRHPKRVAIFKSMHKANDAYLNWESIYFERLFSEHLMDGITYTIDEETLSDTGLDPNTELLIIPAVTVKDSNYTHHIDSLFTVSTDFKESIDKFLINGGTIYAEGNAPYFMEKLGYLEAGTFEYNTDNCKEGTINTTVSAANDIISLGSEAAGNKLYGSKFPIVNSTKISTIISDDAGNPVLFKINSNNTFGGTVICNTGLPTVNGLANLYSDNQQISWTLNSILAAFSHEIDVTRKVRNELIYHQLANNSISYDRLDTFNVELTVRNLSEETITIDLTEQIKDYFTFYKIVSGPTPTRDNNTLSFTDLSINAHTETVIIYSLITPNTGSGLHEDVDDYLNDGTLMAASTNTTSFEKGNYKHAFNKNKDYADLLFSANIFADTDVNWKNFLGLDYQPFKVFMIMENKSRSAAENTVYEQYIPKDVPFYWSDQSLNIPILKTPGGEFVDILRGSDDQDNPEYDIDNNGDPDVWLDTASIYPKGYSIRDTTVYWANPWNHLKEGTGATEYAFEDIDHDGIVPTDTDGDGIPDTNLDEDDKIRVWVVTWDIGHVAGYEYYDPYCSYEIWVDPPNLVPMSAGVGYALDSLDVDSYPGMYYPYTSDIESADINDTTWTHWMEKDENGNVIWKQFIHQSMHNYEGFTWVDTSEYQLMPYDSLIGTTPQPHREFLAVLSLGGEEIDMTNWTPSQSLYSKVNYETVFGEEKVTPIRTTYTYWAPLPNPLQFEYLSNNFEFTDTTGKVIEELPEYGEAHIKYDMDASTEYTYYWVRNVGYDVDFNDPSNAIDGVEGLGDGVFGYFVYEIPKGMGGYSITLPKNEDGTYNTDSIVQIDGKPFERWIDNPNTLNEVQVWENSFSYQVYIPQLLIPAALDDDNFDGVDDWIDDRGDRFQSETGYLNDAFMLGNGETYESKPDVPFTDVGMAGYVDSGWDIGDDGEPGDDWFEALGKTHITIHADYEGRGREGSVEISKGGVLVCEEIFGGSPWVIFSHILSGFAKGTDVVIESEVSPETVYYGVDTVYLKHTISDENEPHFFDANFAPYHISYGYGESTVTTYVGAKDPCNLISPAISMPAILDPEYDNHTITLIPHSEENPEIDGYPKENITGTFVEVRIEVGNSTDNNWINTSVTPHIDPSIGSVEMSYVAYPRPLVPGDFNETITTGWRFNQPEGEVLMVLGDTLNLLQPTRKAYFVFLVKVNPSLENGIYEIPFTMNGKQEHYTGSDEGTVEYVIPNAKFSIVDKDENGIIQGYEKIVLDSATLSNLLIASTGNFQSTGVTKVAPNYFNVVEFETTGTEIDADGNEIGLSQFKNFPNTDTAQLVIVQQGIVDSYNTDAEIITLTTGQTLTYTDPTQGELTTGSGRLTVKPIGPRVKITNKVYSIDGKPVSQGIDYDPDEDLYVQTLLTVTNTGTDVSSNTVVRIDPGPYYTILEDSLKENCKVEDGMLVINFPDLIPGELSDTLLPFLLEIDNIPEEVDIRTVIDLSNLNYEGTLVDSKFSFEDPEDVMLDIYDFETISITYDDNGDGTVTVYAETFNRGIAADSVWFRIYPIIGGGAYEFPFAEKRIVDYQPGDKIKITGTYTIPTSDKSVQFIAIIDDSYKYTEIVERNNTITIDFLGTTAIDNTLEIEQELTIYPQPFIDEVNFSYSLKEKYTNIEIVAYDLTGKVVVKLENCPSNVGSNTITWQNSSLQEGTYLYLINGKDTSCTTKNLFNGKMVKTKL